MPLLRFCRLLLAALLLAGPAFAEAPAARRTVVILHSLPQDVPGLRELSTAVAEGLQKGAGGPVDVANEYTGLDRYASPAYDATLMALYREKYAGRKVDLLVVVGPTALDFVVSRNFLPEVPVVTCYVAERFVTAARAKRPQLTGALSAKNAPLTVDLMLQLYPDTRRIHVVLGASQYERDQARMGQVIFQRFAGRVALDYLNDLTLAQMEDRVRKLPNTDLVLYGSLLQDATGRDFTTNEGLHRISAASRRPVFGVLTEDLGEGLLGGVLLSMELSGAAAAKLGVRILDGESAASIPLVQDTGAAPMFDARQMKRWGLKASHLPTGALVRFQTPSLWDAYWKEITLAVAIMALEGLLVAGLVVQLRRRKRTERALADAELRYRTVADFTHDWEFWLRPDGHFEYASPASERLTGHPPEAFRQDPRLLSSLVSPEDRTRWETFQGEALAGGASASLAYRLHRRDGEVRWVEQDNNPVVLADGSPAGTRGSLRDITERKASELSLRGAYDEIRALKDQLEAENTYYREKIQAVEGSSELLGQSDAIKFLLFRIRQVAPSETTVLIQGETGTGKELVAEAIHAQGNRKDRPLVKINCAALPHSLAESELFGHERGAFTGAQAQRKGRFELADGATLFLDEVGELSPEIQAKLLRVLQDGDFQRVGGTKTLHVDVRVIAATNRDLAKEVAAGRFREDLWYRLNVFPITVPPLRQRKEDIPLLAQTFLERVCHKLGREPLQMSRSVLQSLQDHAWPGNVRELQNLMEQAVLGTEGPLLRLPERLGTPPPTSAAGVVLKPLLDLERDHIRQVLEATAWKVEGPQGAAALLGLKPSTLRSRMQKLGIERQDV